MTAKLHSEFANADDSPGFMLWRVSNTWQAAQRVALAPFDLTHVQFVLLATLTWLRSGAPISQRELANQAHTDPMMTSQVLRTLEGKGLVRREPHPIDGRSLALTVTRSGAALANEAVEAVDRAFFSRLESDLPNFTDCLRRLSTSRKDLPPL